jgi:hypothetical protein
VWISYAQVPFNGFYWGGWGQRTYLLFLFFFFVDKLGTDGFYLGLGQRWVSAPVFFFFFFN